jgi:hypothetical protein
MPDRTSTEPPNDELGKLVDTLACASGLTLALVEGSVSIEGESIVMTAMSRGAPRGRNITLDAVAKVFIAEAQEGKRATWALIFFYIDGRRVAAEGLSHVAFSLDDGGEWKKLGWERDEYNEWGEMSDAER